MTGAELPLLNISLGGVRRVTEGAAKACVAPNAARHNADSQNLDGEFDNFIDRFTKKSKLSKGKLMLVLQ